MDAKVRVSFALIHVHLRTLGIQCLRVSLPPETSCGVKFIITFHDVSGSLRTEQVLKRRSIPCVIDAAPHGLGTGCVYIIRTEAETRGELAAVLDDAGIRWADIVESDTDGA
jgi:hypothetical protein